MGRECRLDVGAAALMSCGDVGRLDSPCATRYLSLLMPRRRLNAIAVNPEDALARPIPADTEALGLLVDYVETALHEHQLTSPQLRQLFTTDVHDLVALSLGATLRPPRRRMTVVCGRPGSARSRTISRISSTTRGSASPTWPSAGA